MALSQQGEPADAGPAEPSAPLNEAWLTAFHAGERECLGACYEAHFELVDRAVGGLLRGADRENVVHEVFYRLVEDRGLRAGFRGGAFGAWLRVVARNQAIDYLRRRRPELPVPAGDDWPEATPWREGQLERQLHARQTLERFRREVLPPKWEAVFVARFVDQLTQDATAERLGVSRTTLSYQERRIRALLEKLVLRGDRR